MGVENRSDAMSARATASKHKPLAWFERKFTYYGEFKTDVQAFPDTRGVQWKCKLRLCKAPWP